MSSAERAFSTRLWMVLNLASTSHLNECECHQGCRYGTRGTLTQRGWISSLVWGLERAETFFSPTASATAALPCHGWHATLHASTSPC